MNSIEGKHDLFYAIGGKLVWLIGCVVLVGGAVSALEAHGWVVLEEVMETVCFPCWLREGELALE